MDGRLIEAGYYGTWPQNPWDPDSGFRILDPRFQIIQLLLCDAQKTEYRDISGQFFLKSHLIFTKTRNIIEKILHAASSRQCRALYGSCHFDETTV